MSPDIIDRASLMNVFMHVGPAGVVWLVVKATLLVASAALVQVAMRRRGSAAARHLVWTLALASLLLLPLAAVVLPDWPLIVRSPSLATAVLPSTTTADVPAIIAGGERPALASPPPAPAHSDVAQTPVTPAAQATSWTAIATAIYVVVSGLLLVRLIVERWRVRRFASRAAAVTDEAWLVLLARCANNLGIVHPVRLLRSVEPGVPAALGTVRPAIVIPAIAETWTDDRRRAVLLHELAHVARWDCFTQGLAAIVCAVYWFHPAAWWIARRLRVERELACDDRAIAAGTEPREYAGHLLEIAYAFGRHRAPALAVSMARRSQIEGRLLAALDVARNRTTPAVRVRIGAAVVAAVLLLAIAGARPTAVAAESATEAMAAPPAVASQEQSDVVRHVQDVARRALRAVAQATGLAQDGLPGTWEIRPTATEGTVHLRLVEFRNSSGTHVRLADLDGLTAAQLATGGPVQFRVRRDAGTFTFEGVARGGVAAGTFTFGPDPAFAGELAKRGFARPSAAEQYQLARHDIGFAFVDELTKQGYAKPSTSELVRAGQHGVNLTYVREMGALGHRFSALDPLITLRDHGVSPDYIRGLEAEGYKGLSADALRKARDHGISPEYVRGMRDVGYGSLTGSLTMEALIKARDHGVSPEYARELAALGHRKLPLDELIRVRDHGVSVEYAREMRELGHALPIDGLVRARDHGVGVEYVRDLAALGYKNLPIDTLIRMRDHGVGTDYVRELQGLGYKGLSVDDLVGMRDHGLSIERIRNANARAGTRLPLDLLKSLSGMR